jgi:hypothetical protein
LLLLLGEGKEEKREERYNEERNISYSFGIVREAWGNGADGYKESGFVRLIGSQKIYVLTLNSAFFHAFTSYSKWMFQSHCITH